jgi:hypothetical protein
MFTTVTLQLPTPTLLRLVEQLNRQGGSQDMSETITKAVESWLDAHNQASAAEPSGVRGYQWKSLFLPEGTILRSWSYGEHNYARVEGDKIMHDGQSVSPNQFARYFARTTRNAWFDLSVRRPGDKHFKMACVLRKELVMQQKADAVPSATIAPAAIAPAAAPTHVPAPMQASMQASPMPSAQKQPESQAQPQPEPQPSSSSCAPPRNTDREPGWNLPERRKFRYRLEDVAY